MILKKNNDKNEQYISELEEKIVELSLNLKSKKNELSEVRELNGLIIKKLIHNLKNPIGVAFSFSDMILEGLTNYTPEKLEKHINIIKTSSNFSINLLNKFAEFYRYQSPELTFNFKENNYIDLINKVVTNFEEVLKEKKISIECKFSSQEIYFSFDEDEIYIAISNILNNAIRYSNENSAIIIEVVESENTIDTFIADKGMGISEMDLIEILNPFYVVNTFSNDKQKCIGLGLAISNKIIQSHQGKISFKSAIDKGTTVKTTLPNNKE